jgi:Glu-tRNA(Gln) amidotransferase subunit E-like FAD-binding protein
MSIFAGELEQFGNRLEELIAHVASEKMQVVLEDLAEDHIPDVVDRKVDKAFEEMDLPAHILRKVEAVDLQSLVKHEVEKIVVKLLENQLHDVIRKQVLVVLMSDEIQNLMTNVISAQAKAIMELPEVTRKLEELAKERMSNTLQRWTTILLQNPGNSSTSRPE